jgi:hypothetical protein
VSLIEVTDEEHALILARRLAKERALGWHGPNRDHRAPPASAMGGVTAADMLAGTGVTISDLRQDWPEDGTNGA